MPSLLFSQEDWGLEAELELLEEEEEVVESALKYKKKISESPSAITIISEDDIIRSGANSIPELLRVIPGMTVKYFSPGSSILNIRDQAPKTANRVLILIDGREVAWELLGTILWEVIGITPADIKRIEVIRGPGSALYGANAFSGVINIQTKKPADINGLNSNITVYDNRNFYLNGSASSKGDDTQYLISANAAEADDWFSEDETAFGFQSGRGLIEGEFLEGLVTAELGGSHLRSILPSPIVDFDLSGIAHYSMMGYRSDHLRLKTYWNRFSFDAGFSKFITGLDIYDMLQNIEFMGLKLEYREEAEQALMDWLGVGPDKFDDVLNVVIIDLRTKITANTYDISGDYTWEPIRRNKFIVGGNARRSTFESIVFVEEDASENKAGVFLQDEIRLFDMASLTLGARYDYSNKADEEFSPRASLVVLPITDHSLRFSVGRAFRRPAFLENQVAFLMIRDLFVGNKDLKNEKILTYEAGYMGRFLRGRIRAGVDYYYNILSDFIDLKIAVDGRKNVYENSPDKIYNQGVDTYIEFRPANWFRGELNYSYLSIDKEGDDPRNYPKNKANLILSFTPGKFITTIYTRYVQGYHDRIAWTSFQIPSDPDELMSLLNAALYPENYIQDLEISELLVQEDKTVEVDHYIAADIKIGYRLTDNIEFGLIAKNLGADNHRETAGDVINDKNVEGEPIPTYYGTYLKARF